MSCNTNCNLPSNCITCLGPGGYTPPVLHCTPNQYSVGCNCYKIILKPPLTTSGVPTSTGTATLLFGASLGGWLTGENNSYTIDFNTPTTTGEVEFTYSQTCCTPPSFTTDIVMTGDATGSGSVVVTVSEMTVSLAATVNYTYQESKYQLSLSPMTTKFNCCGKTRFVEITPTLLNLNSTNVDTIFPDSDS